MNESMRCPYFKIGAPVCFFLLALFIGGFRPGPAEAYTEEDCIKCHTQRGIGKARKIPQGEFEASIHYVNGMGCLDCHDKVMDESHTVSGGSGVVDCNRCHDQQNHHAFPSAADLVPKCYSCHTKHAIQPKDSTSSSVNLVRLKETCRRCHPTQCGAAGYASWLPSLRVTPHGKADFAGEYAKSDCLGCHQGKGAHGEDEPLNKRDCAICHMNQVRQSGLLSRFHNAADPTRQPSFFLAAVFYQIGLLVLLLGGFRFYSQKFSSTKKGK